MTDELSSHAPKYLRIADAIRRDIKTGTYKPGDRLPAETALLDRFRSELGTLSLPTLRQAIRVLRAEGLIDSQQGVGTFVRGDRRLQRRSRKRYGRARADKKLLTADLEHEIIFVGTGTPPDYVADASTLDEDAPVVIRRRLLHDKETKRPEELGATYVPASFAAGTLLEKPGVVPKALFLCVEDLSGRRYAHAQDRWQVRPATADEARLLEIPAGTSVIHLVHNASDKDGQTLEVSESIWPADRILVIDDYEIAQEPEDATGLSDV